MEYNLPERTPADQKTGIRVKLVKGSYEISENLSARRASSHSGLGPRPVPHVAEGAIASEPKYEVGIVLECHSDNQVRTGPQAETQPRLQLDKKPHIPRGQVESKGKITIPTSPFGRGPWDGMVFRETFRTSGVLRTACRGMLDS
jgi:hypothetical protein